MMEGEERRNTSTDESGPERNPADDESEQKTLLEEEIKKIIGDLDVRFVDLPVEGAGTMASGAPPGSSVTNVQKAETQHLRIETASTTSNATTVVQHRVPAKISVTHVQSPRETYHRSNIQPQVPMEMSHGSNRLPEIPRHQGIPMDTNRHYGVEEHGFYQPERDEISDPTTGDTVHTSTENTTTSYTHQVPTYYQPRAPQHGYLPSLQEERSRDFRDGHQYQQHQQHPYEMLPNNDLNAQFPPVGQPSADPTRYPSPPNYAPAETRDNQYHPQHYQDYARPYPPEVGETYQMKENVNRYNSNHRTYSSVKEPERPSRQSFTDYLLTKSRSFFGRREDSDSGEVIPQLYKACVKNGANPPRFTFKAVTGAQPHVAPFQSNPTNQQSTSVVPNHDRPIAHGAQPCYEPVNPCCCPQELPRTYRSCCENNCEIINMPGKSGIKTKAYYSDMGCGYISEAAVPEKVDIYCFDQLNTGFFRTSDHPPPLFADIAVQRTEKFANVFWAEVYGVANVGTAFAIALFLQTIKFALQGIIRPLMIGTVQLLSDYFIKPLLTLLYNGLTQPISIFIYNVIASIRDILQPIAKGVGYFAEVVAIILRSIRLVEVKNVTNITPCSPPHSVKYTC